MGYLEQATQTTVSRRGFVKAGAAAAAATALTGALTGCSPQSENAVELSETSNPEEGATWIPAACWHGCSTRMCVNKVLVKDGIVLRQKSDDNQEDSIERPQHRGCLRGRSQRKHVFGADRLKYPMKRKHWEPLTGGDKSLRGKDEWERITWDEALDYVAAEIKSVIEKYGNAAILADGVWSRCTDNFFNRIGGFTALWGTHSYGAYSLPVLYNGFQHRGQAGGNDRMDLENVETFVMFGCNPAWSACGIHSYFSGLLKQEGKRFIAVDPFYNDSYAMFDAEWVPVYPGQDDALILGVAYVLLTEDDPASNPLIDWDFLSRCTIGFDADHMPEGEDPKGNFKDYVLGTYDGVPKTPEWASALCGAPVEQIKNLAYAVAPENKVAIMTSWGPARVNNADHISQIIMTLGAMTGHMGKSGHMTGISCDSSTADGGPRLFTVGSDGNPSIDAPVNDCINSGELWDAVINGEYTYNGRMLNYGFANLEPIGEKRPCDIHLIYNAGREMLSSRENILKGVEAFRKVDFVVTHAWVPNAVSMYSDIVLPISTPWERAGRIAADGTRDAVVIQPPVCEPLFEAKSDQDIVRELCKRFDIPETDIFSGSEKQQLFNQIAGTTMVGEDGETPEPMAKITQEDIDSWGVEGAPQDGKYPLSQLWEEGICIIPRKAGDNYGYIAYEDFVADPEANPLENSESGKFEIYCKKMSDTISGMGYGSVSPLPEYVPKANGFEATFSDVAGKQKGDYPLQAFSPRGLRSIMSAMSNVPQLQEAVTNPVFMNASDAEERGLANGDAVRVSSPYGAMIRMVSVTNRLIPGAVAVPYCGWLEYDEAEKADRGGAHNVLTGSIAQGQGTSGYNSSVVQIEKYDGEVIADANKPQNVIFEDGE
ncbi:molybdopterin-dependent oxidoreductase [Adlercreutzia sp. R21]|uniref:molybdopterin-dependent oxidoreductase n=1 Tax=Adlercreutzia wanghongyangiae TaxID=3111451 RepID=UPI002DB94573|nr:molybdopterin-dependent oxidoreductase [Adlercreutzia sp. R21]MEC4183544.1 molybdopterin-dependent oxidoreductase [Adlercreutzia sp. R21]